MPVIYDVLLSQQDYEPVIGHFGEPKYMCLFYDEDRNKALKEMRKYVKEHGFTAPDGKFAVADVVLRERKPTGEEISITPYYKLFDTITGELLK